MTKQTSKRILSVTIKRMIDTDPDTSWMGEYSDTPQDYAIVNRGEHEGEFADSLSCECGHPVDSHVESDDYAIGSGGIKCSVDGCDCEDLDRVEIERGRSYRYFNPVAGNYEGEPDAEIRKYCLQDFKRMQDYNNQQWCFYGFQAEARVQTNGLSTIQVIKSGGLWGIESDSEDSYFKETEKEQLAELRSELHAIGFTKRAISAAFRNVEHKDA